MAGIFAAGGGWISRGLAQYSIVSFILRRSVLARVEQPKLGEKGSSTDRDLVNKYCTKNILSDTANRCASIQ